MKASDFLESGKNRSYSPDNVCDQNWRTAWVENAAGFGKGEKVEFIFRDKDGQKTDPTLTLGVASFFNGYIKSEKTWKENNRVKTLGVLYNGKKIFTIHLSDTMFHQTVLFDPVKIKPGVSLGFEIEEVYPGEKYDDTVITEILFEDGNCLGETGE